MIRERNRLISPERLEAEISERRQTVFQLCKEAGKFLALDTRPMIISPDGVERLGPSPVPPALMNLIADEKAEVERLTQLYVATYRT